MPQGFGKMQSDVQSSTLLMPSTREQYLANGWGWFVDIETGFEPLVQPPPQKVPVLKTINEYPSIRSMKSMKNLHDTSMMFKIDDIDDSKHRTLNFIKHAISLVGVALCYYFVSEG